MRAPGAVPDAARAHPLCSRVPRSFVLAAQTWEWERRGTSRGPRPHGEVLSALGREAGAPHAVPSVTRAKRSVSGERTSSPEVSGLELTMLAGVTAPAPRTEKGTVSL